MPVMSTYINAALMNTVKDTAYCDIVGMMNAARITDAAKDF